MLQYLETNTKIKGMNSYLFQLKIVITGSTLAADNVKEATLDVPLKYLSNFWKTLEMPIINHEISVVLTWSKSFTIVNIAAGSVFHFSASNTEL